MPVPDSETEVLISAVISGVAGTFSGETVGVGDGITTGSKTAVVSGVGVEIGSDETGVSATGVSVTGSANGIFSVCCGRGLFVETFCQNVSTGVRAETGFDFGSARTTWRIPRSSPSGLRRTIGLVPVYWKETV